MYRVIAQDLRKWWGLMPHKGIFFGLLAAWVLLFHLAGNSTYGPASLFTWMYLVFTGYEDDALCLYIPLVITGLMIWKRDELMAAPLRPWWQASGLIVAGLLLHVVGYAVQQTRVSILGFAVGLYGLTGLVWGPTWLRKTFFPMFLLVFLIPISAVSEGITLPLRLLATRLAVGVSNTVLGIEVYHNGAQILGPDNIPLYEVVAACSGIRSLISMILLMLIYAWMSFRSGWRRAALIASAVPVTILGNVLRLVTVILVGEAFGKDAAVAVEQKLGFLTFGLGLVCMFALGHWLREPTEEPAAVAEVTAPAGFPHPRPLVSAVVVVLLIGGVGLAIGRLQSAMHLGKPGLRMITAPVLAADGRVIGTNTVALPARVLDYASESYPIAETELSFLPEDTTFARRYYKNPEGSELMLSVVLMGQNRRSIHRPQICLTGQGWTIDRSDLLEVSMKKPQAYSLPVMRLIASRTFRDPSGRTQLMKAVYVYWFVADGQLSARHGQRQWWMARDLLTQGVLQRWAYVSCLAVGRPGSEEALYRQIEEFVAAAVPEFQTTPPPVVVPDLAPEMGDGAGRTNGF